MKRKSDLDTADSKSDLCFFDVLYKLLLREELPLSDRTCG
jgi:hypothetical protein